MSLTASRQLLQQIRGSVEAALTKIDDVKTESSSLASDSSATYNGGLTTINYSDTNREQAIEHNIYANHVNKVAFNIEKHLNDILNLINQV